MEKVKKNTYYQVTGWFFVIYSLVEIIDCITVTLMTFSLINNSYPEMYYKPMEIIFQEHPVYLIPLFLAITGLRVFSAIGLLKEKFWGFWIAISIIFITYILVPFMLPLSVVDFLICSIILILLIIGKFKNININ